MPYVDVPGAQLFYEVEGSTGAPVLLIMGFGVPGRMWKAQVRALAPHHQVAWFDNHAASDGPSLPRPTTIHNMAAQAIAVLDVLGWDTAHIVGVSMGGMIAQELALGFRARLRSLTLIATHAGGLTRLLPQPKALKLFASAFLGPKRKRAHALQQLVFPEEWLDANNVDKARLRDALDRKVAHSTPLSSRVSHLTAIVRHRAGPRLHELSGLPTLVIKPARDVLIDPKESDRLADLIPGAKLLVLPDAGHGLLHQCADEVSGALLEHFERVD